MVTTTLNLEKGQRLELTKTNPTLKKLRVGLSWDVKPGFQADADASCVCLGENEKMLSHDSIVCYSTLNDRNNIYNKSIVHSGDNLTGDGDGDDETITIDLASVPSNVASLLFTISMYGHGEKTTFGRVKNCTCRLYNADTNEVICTFDLSEDFSTSTAIEMAKVYRKDNDWKVEAVGLSIGTAQNGLTEILTKYSS